MPSEYVPDIYASRKSVCASESTLGILGNPIPPVHTRKDAYQCLCEWLYRPRERSKSVQQEEDPWLSSHDGMTTVSDRMFFALLFLGLGTGVLCGGVVVTFYCLAIIK